MKTDMPAIDLKRRGWWQAIERFWFTPADPTLLGLTRICCGLVVFYTLLVYSFRFQDLMGDDAWQDLEMRLKQAYDEPRHVDAMRRNEVIPPATAEEAAYNEAYLRKWKRYPPV